MEEDRGRERRKVKGIGERWKEGWEEVRERKKEGEKYICGLLLFKLVNPS